MIICPLLADILERLMRMAISLVAGISPYAHRATERESNASLPANRRPRLPRLLSFDSLMDIREHTASNPDMHVILSAYVVGFSF
jgi:hypothetical protein